MTGSESDQVLVDRARTGDHGAFEALVRRHEKNVYNLTYRMAGNHHDAADLAQEAFLRAYTRLADFGGHSAFSTWLYRVTANVCLDELRRRGRRPAASLDQANPTDDSEVYRQVADPAPGPEEAVTRRETEAAVQAGLLELPEEFRLVVVLRDLQGYAYEEIAEVLNLPLGTVKSRLNRARLALRDVFLRMELFGKGGVEKAGPKGGRRLRAGKSLEEGGAPA